MSTRDLQYQRLREARSRFERYAALHELEWARQEGYEEGFREGYKEGFEEGFREGLKEVLQNELSLAREIESRLAVEGNRDSDYVLGTQNSVAGELEKQMFAELPEINEDSRASLRQRGWPV